MRIKTIFFLLLISGLSLQAQQLQFSKATLQKNLYFLASDSLKGRFPGTAEDKIAVSFIRNYFESNHLILPEENGLQPFTVTTSVEASSENSLAINTTNGVYGTDFSLYTFSSNTTLSADVVFTGFGMSIETDDFQWNDYENLDVKDKWVLVLKGDPEPENNDSRFIPFADTRTKTLFARDKGAKGILFIGGSKNNPSDELAPLLFERAVVSAGIPAIDIKKVWAESHLLGNEMTIDSLEKLIIAGGKPYQFSLNSKVTATTSLVRNDVTTYNIIGILVGSDPVLKDEYVVIGAHYDHLGMGGQGSGSRMPDTIAAHIGADDNASGTTGVMELAAMLSKNQVQLKRSVLFVLFGAEEMGLLGSRHFVKNLPLSKEKVVAMLNLDMIGRLNEKSAVAIGGTGTAKEIDSLLTNVAKKGNLQLSFSPEGFGASDHASFYAENIPVMFFSTGAHSDYHTPLDSPDKINYDGMIQVLELVGDVAIAIANSDEQLNFTEAGPKERATGRRGFKVTLGIMPDFTSNSTDGLGVGGVTKGGPADRGGMLKGDKITGINGMPVGTIYDYMNRLKQLKPGQRVNVDVERNNEKMILIVDL
ncbi:MAG: hypothetical protein CVT92_05460 [Bacteroidetes bacterium HGW-Bacteroidetes-1]|jgi:hypothetical protein|nr:MAG: hypothetical protein CVT92_05460 [Bacteroidetes bacterium HGW-Bacteroidetes-1]